MSIRVIPAALTLLAASASLLSGEAYANTCYWDTANPAGPIRYVADVTDLYVPRDARIGDSIGPADRSFVARSGGPRIFCATDGTRLTFQASSNAPIARSVGANLLGTVLATNIPGVGARISFGSPYDGNTNGYWKLNGPDSSIPFSGYIDFLTPFTLQHSLLAGVVTLVKTGPISSGRQDLDSGNELVKASFTGVPDAFGLALSGSVTQAECSLSANPVSADPVKLGDWSTTQFTGVGHTTDAVPFTIALNACISDPLPGGTVTNAHIRLEPTAGSTTLDAGKGLFSLGGSSTAQGIGIQVLGSDAVTPVALEADVAQGALPVTGGMLLEFNARFYQTGSVAAGSAQGSLAFTITYK
ncbi:fimbrial protein [Pseudomonas silesiensis]